MTKTNKDIWHKTKTTLKIGDKMNTTAQGDGPSRAVILWGVKPFTFVSGSAYRSE